MFIVMSQLTVWKCFCKEIFFKFPGKLVDFNQIILVLLVFVSGNLLFLLIN